MEVGAAWVTARVAHAPGRRGAARDASAPDPGPLILPPVPPRAPTPAPQGGVFRILKNWPERNVRVVCITDGEHVGSMGDLGVQARRGR